MLDRSASGERLSSTTGPARLRWNPKIDFAFIFLLIGAVLVAAPLLWMFSTSLRPSFTVKAAVGQARAFAVHAHAYYRVVVLDR